jgi:hypothetical protein
MNSHVQTMKNALGNYHKSVKAGLAKMEENNRLYRPEEAKKANATVLSRIEEEQNTAKRIIAEAREAGMREAGEWGKLDGSKITDDSKLLFAETVTPDQFRELVQKYQNNSTMLQLLSDYAEKKNEASGGFSAAWNYDGQSTGKRQHFDTSGIPTADKKKHSFDLYAAQASNLVDRIGNLEKGKMGAGPESPFIMSEIENYGSDADF